MMTRVLISVPQENIDKLDALAKRNESSRAALIREALVDWIQKHEGFLLEEAFGILKNHDIDGLEFQKKMRNEW